MRWDYNNITKSPMDVFTEERSLSPEHSLMNANRYRSICFLTISFRKYNCQAIHEIQKSFL